jgi:hypothetical protein
MLAIGFTDSIEKIRLTLFQIVCCDTGAGRLSRVLRHWWSRNWSIASGENRERADWSGE